MLNLHIESDDIGCHVYIRMYFGYISYYSDLSIEEELKLILKANQPNDNFEENFYKILNLKKNDVINCIREKEF